MEELLNQYNGSEVLVILYKEGGKGTGKNSPDGGDGTGCFTAPLQVLLAKQNPLLWGENLLPVGNQGRNRTMQPQLTVNDEQLTQAFEQLPEVQQGAVRFSWSFPGENQ